MKHGSRARAAAVLVLCLATAVAGTWPRHAEAATSSAFSPLPAGARTWGMAGTSVALADDAYATLANPARLAFLDGRQANVGYARLVEGLTNDRLLLAFATPIGEDITAPGQGERAHKAAFGLAAEFQNLELSEGSGYGELSLTGAFAWAPSNFAAVGAGFRYLTAGSDLDGVSASGLALDLGATVALYPQWEVAFVYRNLGGSVEFEESGAEDLARHLSLATAWTRNRLADVELEMTWESSQAYWGSLGAEVEIGGALDLRAGARRWIKPEGRWVPAAGAGVHLGRFRFDYGARFDGVDALGITHQGSLGASF